MAATSAAAIAAAGNVYNDLRDLDTDRINRPDRPLPAGRIPARVAAAQAVLDRGRVNSADTRREAAAVASAVHRAAVDGHRADHARAIAAIEEAAEGLQAEGSGAAALRRAFDGLNMEED